MSEKSKLLIPGQEYQDVYQQISPEKAGWQLLNFMAIRLQEDQRWYCQNGDTELALVILGGKANVRSSKGEWLGIGRRPNVFCGMPYALYLPRDTEMEVIAMMGELDFACGWCRVENDYPAKLIRPEEVRIEIRGGGNATRQINHIIPPGFFCQRLVVCEVYTPSGNWSSYPPHKHDVHRSDNEGTLVEADLEEIYFYKINPPDGFAYQRVYSDDGHLDELIIVRNNGIVLVPEGYHPVVSAHGYTTYYLNFLAGSAQSLASYDDPQYRWIKETWKELDPRVPVVSMEMEQ